MDWTGYSDSTRTGDRKYVVASFRADANLSWVIDLRSFLNLPELKYRDYSPRRQYVASNPRIHGGLIQGLAEAEITVIDRRPYQATAYLDLRQRGAELGADFDFETINELASDQALRESPFGIAVEEETWGFPANRIPLRRESYSDRLEELPEFDVSSIREQAGGKLSDVEVVVGRANSMLSPSEFQELRLRACEPHFRQSFREGIDRIKKLAHIFDAEHPKSLPLLNGLAGRLAAASGVPVHVAARLAKNLPIREASSTNSDHIQAADIASGWASDLLLATNNDYRVLAQQVRWLTINGLAVPA